AWASASCRSAAAACGDCSSQRLRPLKAACAPRQMNPVRLSAKPSATVWRPQPKRVSANRGLPPQYVTAISASKARRVGPLTWDAAKRRSAICDELSDGRYSSGESCMHMIEPLERGRDHLPEGSSEHAYSSLVIS